MTTSVNKPKVGCTWVIHWGETNGMKQGRSEEQTLRRSRFDSVVPFHTVRVPCWCCLIRRLYASMPSVVWLCDVKFGSCDVFSLFTLHAAQVHTPRQLKEDTTRNIGPYQHRHTSVTMHYHPFLLHTTRTPASLPLQPMYSMYVCYPGHSQSTSSPVVASRVGSSL